MQLSTASKRGAKALQPGMELLPVEPLWKRVPTKGDDGRPLSDFMMLIPGLKKRPILEIEMVLDSIQQTLRCYRHAVVFADLNLKLNLLWISVKPIPGICLEIATAVNAGVPEAKLVANRAEVQRQGA